MELVRTVQDHAPIAEALEDFGALAIAASTPPPGWSWSARLRRCASPHRRSGPHANSAGLKATCRVPELGLVRALAHVSDANAWT
jgi:hypothetical protein